MKILLLYENLDIAHEKKRMVPNIRPFKLAESDAFRFSLFGIRKEKFMGETSNSLCEKKGSRIDNEQGKDEISFQLICESS